MYNKEWEKNIKSGIKKGDILSFRRLYQRFYSGLCVLSYRYTGQPEIAEEIVQETFMKIWENREKIEIKGSLPSYLFTAVRNRSLNYLKHLMIEKKFSAKKAMALQQTINYLHISQEDGLSILIAEELQKSLDDAIASLPPKCREIFLLSREEDQKYSDIAKKLGISQNTVQKQMSIALEKLRDKLAHLLKL